ncbi:MAG: porin [Pontibacterium sp.]
MKKLILAAAVAAVTTGSVNAATVYEGKGLKYDLKGDWQVQFRQKKGENKDSNIEFDDLELKNRVTYELSDGMKAFGQMDFGFKDAADDKQTGSDLEEAYLGMNFGQVSAQFGKMDFVTDSFGVEASVEEAEDDAFDFQKVSGGNVIRVDANFDNIYVGASTELEAKADSGNEDSSVDLFVVADLDVAEVGAAYQSYEDSNSNSVDTWGVMASFDAGFATLAVDYSSADDKVDVYNLVASFKLDKTTKAAVGYNNTEENNADDVGTWYANVTYKFPAQKNVSVFAEIANSDEDNSDMGYLAGMRIKF